MRGNLVTSIRSDFFGVPFAIRPIFVIPILDNYRIRFWPKTGNSGAEHQEYASK